MLVCLLQKEIVLKALKSPYKRVIEFALTYVNLNDREKQIINYCFVSNFTAEETAEKLDISVSSVCKMKSSILIKIQKSWVYCEVLPILLDIEN